MQRVRAGVAALCLSTLVFVCSTHAQLPGLRRRPARSLGVEASVLEQALTHALHSGGVHNNTKPGVGTLEQTPSRGLPPGVVALQAESGAGAQKSPARDAGSQKELPALEFGTATAAGADGQRRGLPAKPFACFRSDALKFAFVHIPKNAGSAVSRYLEELLCAHAGLESTCGLKLARGACPQDPAYYVFTFSRNPWARAVSMWSYGMKRLQLETQDVQERKAIARRYCTFEAFLHNLHAGRPQPGCGFHVADRQYPNIYARDGSPGVNFLGRTEHFDRDFRVILKVLCCVLACCDAHAGVWWLVFFSTSCAACWPAAMRMLACGGLCSFNVQRCLACLDCTKLVARKFCVVVKVLRCLACWSCTDD
jgi:hypothetical protein